MRNNLNKCLSSILVLALPVFSMAQTTPKKELSVKLTSPDKTFRLSVGLIEGNINIITHPGKEILVEAEESSQKKKPEPNANANPNANTNNNQNTDINNFRQEKETTKAMGKYVSVSENDNTVRISPLNPYASLNVTIKVPKNTAKLNLSIAQSGRVSVKDVSGETEILNTNGSISLTNISGSVVATTITGDILVTFTSITENSPMAFSTLIGKIDVTFPPSFKANINLHSDAGILFSDYDILFDATGPKMTKVNIPILYRANISGKSSGKINGGGAEILMQNMNGNIYIRKAK